MADVNTYKSNSHSRYLLQFHLIFVCKYRKQLMNSPNIAGDVKRLSFEIADRHKVIIRYMETD
jgi:putative transposase